MFLIVYFSLAGTASFEINSKETLEEDEHDRSRCGSNSSLGVQEMKRSINTRSRRSVESLTLRSRNLSDSNRSRSLLVCLQSVSMILSFGFRYDKYNASTEAAILI